MPTDVTPQEDVAARLAETMQAAVGKDEAPRAIQRMIDGTTDANQVQIYSAALERLQNKSKGMPRSTQSPVAEGLPLRFPPGIPGPIFRNSSVKPRPRMRNPLRSWATTYPLRT